MSADDVIPQAPAEWFAWLASEEVKTRAAYVAKPSTLIADFRREEAIARDYEGREVLELLQNASDQAFDRDRAARVLIEWSADRLLIANDGVAFSTGGVSSLQTSHLSPKRRRGGRVLIGNKGLGFRSILNWSHSPIVLSGSLALAFARDHSEQVLSELCRSSEELCERVALETRDGVNHVVPSLAFPVFTSDGNLGARLNGARTLDLLARCNVLRAEGYTTVIAVPLESPQALEAIEAQISGLRPEILLFVRNLAELKFARPGSKPTVWRREGEDEITEVQANGVGIGMWTVYRISDELPADVKEVDQLEAAHYEIAVAVPINGNASPAPLFSHFPTDVLLPLPVVCHATLELEQNRKHPQQARKSNRFVLHKLASFLADVAEKVATEKTGDEWAGGDLLRARGDFPHELRREGFEDTLIRAARERAIIPTVDGARVKAAAARFVEGASESWLPPALCPEVALSRTAEEAAFLQQLKVSPLPAADLQQRIIQAPELSAESRVALIGAIQRTPSLAAARTSALFLDAQGRGVGAHKRVFLSSLTGVAPNLPEWVDLRFLNEGLRNSLAAELQTPDARSLQQQLAAFGVVEYSLGTLVGAIVSEVNRQEKYDEANATRYQAEALQAIYALYSTDGKGRRPDYPSGSPLRLLSQQGTLIRTDALYLGGGYGSDGVIMQALLETWAPEQLIADQHRLGLPCDTQTATEFLKWIGVAGWPREVELKPLHRHAAPFVDHVLKSIKYPAAFGDKVVNSSDEAQSAEARQIRSVYGLEKILLHADPDAIVAWLSRDDRVIGWTREPTDQGELVAFPNGVYNARKFHGNLPSYVRWLLQSTEWLPATEGDRLRPTDCVLGERAYDQLFPRPLAPEELTRTRFGIQYADVIEGWRRAGVPTSVAYLNRDSLYTKLLELPQRSPDGRLARPLYHWMLEVSDAVFGDDGASAREFRERGRMWGRRGTEERYFNVSELHHADVDGLPQALLDRMTLVDLRRRVGADKVERVFGVRSIDRANVRQELVSHALAVGATDANDDFQCAKPLLYKLRTTQTTQVVQLQFLKELQLVLCNRISASTSYDGASFVYDVSPWGWLVEAKRLYVCVDIVDTLSHSRDLLADAISEALAAAFRIADGGEFARMLACNPKHRLELLRRMRGEAALADLEKIKLEFDDADYQRPPRIDFPIALPPELLPPIERVDAPPVQVDVAPANLIDSQRPPFVDAPLSIVPREHEPSFSKPGIKLRIKTVDRRSTSISRVQVADGEFCERKAMEFEECDSPPRWPLLVGHVTGTAAPGCDILSFRTEEAREAFRIGQVNDLGDVVRFIEVKGRQQLAAAIELRGNELQAAERYGEKYFVYRLFREAEDLYELCVLQHPLARLGALDVSIHVDLERASETRRFALQGGLSSAAPGR